MIDNENGPYESDDDYSYEHDVNYCDDDLLYQQFDERTKYQNKAFSDLCELVD